MQRRHLAACAAVIVLAAAAARAADITGTWTGSFSGQSGDLAVTYNFKQDGAKLTGTVTSSMGGDPLPLNDCKIDGDKISFNVKVDMGGNTATFSSKGVVKNDEITLTTTNDVGVDLGGDITLKRQPK